MAKAKDKEDLFRGNINLVNTRKFSSMTGSEKLAYFGKAIVFIISFGFAFPNLFSED